MSGLDDDQMKELAEFALLLAREAGDVIVPSFRTPLHARNKSAPGQDYDPVTGADLAAEARIRDLIGERFPDHGISGEEMAEKPAKGPFQWVVDPIDGTRSFVYGLPHWMTLVALLHEGRPIIGVARQPLVGESFLGMPDGAWLVTGNGRMPLRTRGGHDLSSAMAGTTLPEIYQSAGQRAVLSAMGKKTMQLRFDADAYFYALLAAGQIDLVFDTGMEPYDIAALIPIVRGAGGIITDWSGRPDPMGGDILAAATPELHAQALSVMGAALDRAE